jgi:coenzyme F420-reducing hydrogenase alpha subunit
MSQQVTTLCDRCDGLIEDDPAPQLTLRLVPNPLRTWDLCVACVAHIVGEIRFAEDRMAARARAGVT